MDTIIDYYNFPRTAPDNSKEIEELEKEKDKLVDNFKKSGRNKVSDEEHNAMEELQDKKNVLITRNGIHHIPSYRPIVYLTSPNEVYLVLFLLE